MSDRFKNIDKVLKLHSKEGYGCLVIVLILLVPLLYSLYNANYLWTIVIITLVSLCFIFILKEHLDRRKIRIWFHENHGRTIFFYPTNKVQQKKIQEVISGKLSSDILRVYYDGPKLIGDIKNNYVSRFMLVPFNMESANLPKFLRVSKAGLAVICDLKEFMEEEIKIEIIDELITQMNEYAFDSKQN